MSWPAPRPPRVTRHSRIDPAKAVPRSPHHGVDEGLGRQLHGQRHREIEELHRGAVDRVPHHLVDGPGDQDRHDGPAGDEEPQRAREESQGQGEENRAQPEPPEEPGGQEHLDAEADDAGHALEGRDEGGQGVGAGPRLRGGQDGLLHDRLELPPDEEGDEGGEADDPGDRLQVGRVRDHAQALPKAPGRLLLLGLRLEVGQAGRAGGARGSRPPRRRRRRGPPSGPGGSRRRTRAVAALVATGRRPCPPGWPLPPPGRTAASPPGGSPRSWRGSSPGRAPAPRRCPTQT